MASSVVIGAYQQRQAKKKAKEAYNASQVDRMANVVTTVAPRELVLGRVRKGGAVAFRGSADQFNATFLVHLTLAAHEIDAIEQIYFNDQPVTIGEGGRVLTAPYMRAVRAPLTNLIIGGNLEANIPPGSTSVVLDQSPDPGSVVAAYQDITGAWHKVEVTVSGSTVSMASTLAYNVRVLYTYGAVQSFATAWWDLGAPGSAADSATKAKFPSMWTDVHRGEGIAKLIVQFQYDETAFPSGIPTVTALIRGAKVYDPRTSTTAWSDNPALLARHVYQHEHFGKATVSAAEDTRFIAAANACDTSQTWVHGGATEANKLYRAGMVAPYGAAAADILDDLCQSMAGMWAFAGGELYVRAGVYTAPVMAFTDSDLAVVQRKGDSESQDQLSISVHRERAEKFNVVNLRIWDSGQDYKQVPLAPVKGTALITRDGEELAQEVSLAAVSYSPQAQHIAGVMMRDARDPLTLEVPLKMRAYPVEIFDTIQLTLARYGWSAKTFVVMSRVWEQEKGVIRLALKETAAAIFTPDATFQAEGFAANTAIPSPWDIEPPGALTVSSGTDELLIGVDGTILTRVRVAWPAITDQRITGGGHVEVQWTVFDTEAWSSIVVNGGVSEAFIGGLSDGSPIIVRARTSHSLATSDWGVQVLHIVAGKTEVPQDVSSFSVNKDGEASWVHVTDADVRAGGGYLLRWQPGNNRSWGDATALHDGVITESPYAVMIRPVGTATFLIKAVDSSGNESENAAVSVVNLGDPIVENVVTISDYDAAGFPGTIVNGSVSGGDLVADADPSPLAWDANADTAGWTLDTDAGWTAITYQPLTYTPESFVVSAADDGAQLTLPNTIVATAYLIAYRRDGDALGWTSDAEPGWTSDTDLAWEVEEFRPWPGTLTAREGRYEFQITTQSRDVQSVISELAAQLDVPDVIENVGEVSIAPAGTVIPATKTFRAITGIGLTLKADGGTAVTARVESTATRTVTTRDATDTAVAGTVLATLQGY